MFKFHITGFAAYNDTYYYSSDHPIDIIVIAATRSEAIAKAEKALEHKIHSETMRIEAEEMGKWISML